MNGAYLKGNVNLGVVAADAASGMQEVKFQYRLRSSGTFKTISIDNSDPYEGLWDTTSVVDGSYTLRAVAKDNVGRTKNANITVIVDNTNPIGTIALGTAIIKDADLTQEVTVTYDESMNVAFTPSISFATTTGAWTSNSDGAWSAGNTVWTETFNLADADEEVATVIVASADGKDLAGNVEGISVADTFVVDTKNPVVGVNSLVTNDNTPEIAGAVDDTAATIQVTVDGNAYAATNNGDSTWTLANDTITPALNDGTYDVSVVATDSVGNTGFDATTDELIIDTVKPVSIITTFGLADGGSIVTPTWDGLVEGTASDDRSGVDYVKLEISHMDFGSVIPEYWNGSAWQAGAVTFNAIGDTAWSYQLPGVVAEGTYQVASHAVDNAGNVESTYSITIIYDKTIPEVTLTIDPTNPNGDNNWYTEKPTITLTANDNYDVDHMEYQLNGIGGAWIVYSGPVEIDNGKWQFYYRSIDTASNVSDIGLKNVKVDTGDPDNVKNLDATYKQDPNRIQLTWDAKDSDIDLVYIYQGKSKNFNVNSSSRVAKNDRNDDNYSDYDVTPGEKYYYKIVTKDEAGNKSSVKIISITLPLEGTQIVVTDEGTEELPVGTVLGEETNNSEGTGDNEEGSAGVQSHDENVGVETPQGQVLGEETSNPEDNNFGGLSFWWWLLIILGIGLLGSYGYAVYRKNSNQTIR